MVGSDQVVGSSRHYASVISLVTLPTSEMSLSRTYIEILNLIRKALFGDKFEKKETPPIIIDRLSRCI